MVGSTHGSCLCGSVRYTVDGPLRSVWQCHCIRCKKTTGNFMAASGAPARSISVQANDTLTWYSPDDDPNVAYGFCSRCGSSLFWRAEQSNGGEPDWSICAGTLDTDDGLHTEAIWFSDHADAHTALDPGARQIPSTEL